LQTNKVKALLPFIYAIHGVGSLKLATEISKRADRLIPIFLEVNLDAEESKSGLQIAELRKVAEEVAKLPNLKILGLMAIPDPTRTDGPRDAFRHLAALERDLRPLTSGELSMGMTSDFRDAIAEGSTFIRVGTAIFGERSPREKL
jgi:pyridoxal phosphate enzyme (YggS family)